MKIKLSFSRYTLLWMVFLCYLLPLAVLNAYQTLGDWKGFTLGMLIACAGTAICFVVLSRWEKLLSVERHNKRSTKSEKEVAVVQEMPQEVLEKKVEEYTAPLKDEIEQLHAEVIRLSEHKDQLQGLLDRAEVELQEDREKAEQQLKDEQTYIRELQNTIAEQKMLLDKKQQQINGLETKVGDLTYEIKTLLQFAESHAHSFDEETERVPEVLPDPVIETERLPPPLTRQIRSSQEASIQLKRCIDIAQRLMGSPSFGRQGMEFSIDSFAIDLRRLSDSLRSENHCAIVLYSPKEEQFLFANNEIRTLTGWSPEKFIHSFSDIAADTSVWKYAVEQLSLRSEVLTKLSLKTKFGQEVLVQAHVGMIPAGVFRNQSIAILYPIG